jgi:hypothetical protein
VEENVYGLSPPVAAGRVPCRQRPCSTGSALSAMHSQPNMKVITRLAGDC